MMKNSFKILIVLLVFAISLALSACGNKTFKCGICNEEKTGKSYKSQVMGQEVIVCEDCYKELSEAFG